MVTYSHITEVDKWFYHIPFYDKQNELLFHDSDEMITFMGK